jgi:hypothetical protein
MTVLNLDLSKPSFRAAYQLARAHRMTWGKAAADALFARLLWHVPGEDGGFLGLTDDEMDAKIAADPRLTRANVLAAMWAPGEWPEMEKRNEPA